MRRNVRLAAAILILAVAAFVGSRVLRGSEWLPPGVSSNDWRRLSDDAGVSIWRRVSGEEAVATLWIKDGGKWRRVNLVPAPPGVVQTR